MKPEEALAAARAAAAEARERGGYADDLRGFRIEPTAEVTNEKLFEWAVIEPDVDQVYSTRRAGAPITAVKQGLIKALRQYLGQITSQQTRFNHHAAVQIAALTERVHELEAEVRRLQGEPDER